MNPWIRGTSAASASLARVPHRRLSARAALRCVFALAMVAALTPWASADDTGVKTPTEDILREAEDRAEAGYVMPRGKLRPLGSRAYCSYAHLNNMLWERYGFLYQVAPTFINQYGTQGGDNDYTASAQVAVILAWEVLRETAIGSGAFVMNYLRVEQLTSTTGLDFTRSLGTNFFPSDSVVDLEIFKALGWRHSIGDDKVVILLGQTLAAEVDGGGRFSVDDTMSFLSQPLSNSPVRAMPGAGWGIGADVSPTEHWTFQAHIQDGRGNGKLVAPSNMFRTGDIAAVVGVELKDPFRRLGRGWYKASSYWLSETGSGTPDAQPSGWGLHLQAEQDFGDFGVFAKFGLAEDRVGLADRYGNAGVVWQKPFGCSEDWLGLGFGVVRPTAKSTNLEYVAEAFWRVQLTPFVQLTPDVQVVFNPSYRPQTDVEAIFSLRFRMEF